MEQLVVLHRPAARAWSWQGGDSAWAVWATCLRQVAIGCDQMAMPELDDGDQVWRGARAYALLLEIICGLHSPVVGETEVFGQFKNFVDGLAGDSVNLPVLRRLIADAKAIRHEHLRSLGSRSYGSLVRKEIQAARAVHLIGFGHLARELLPWLRKTNLPLTVYTRRPAPVPDGVAARSLGELRGVAGDVILAAPVSAMDLKKFLGPNVRGIRRIIDLRGEAAADPIGGEVPVVDLQQVMGRLEIMRGRQLDLIEKIKADIAGRAGELERGAKVRPQGWDDLCA
jgi:glutamyl-tRNA reductase